MEDLCKSLNDSSVVKCLYRAVILVILLVIVYKCSSGSEHYVGSSLGHQGGYSGQTSGASLRAIGQELSATNQAPRSWTSNAEIAQYMPNASTVGRAVDIYANPSAQENLVNGRGEPDFWEIGSQLSAYKDSQVAPMAAAAAQSAAASSSAVPVAASSSERFRGHKAHREHLAGPLGQYEDDGLSSLLHN